MAKKTKWILGGAVAGVAALAAGIFGLRFGYEHASYEVEQRTDTFEVRRYAPRIVAEVAIEDADPNEASRKGFRILADYIFGNNIAEESIAMTTPVDRVSEEASETIAMTTPVDRSGEGRSWTVRFTMPSELALDELPTPRDPRVVLREMEGVRVAALRFSGRASTSAFKQQTATLQAAVNASDFAVADAAQPTQAQYDPPWTPGFLRRNEVMVELLN